MPQLRIDPALASDFAALTADTGVREALAHVERDAEATLAEQKTLATIPAPTFAESERAAYLAARFAELGFADLRLDAAGNVIACRPGSGEGPTLVISAHLDTVYPAGTELSVRSLANGRLEGAGIADDARGLAEILGIARALQATKLATVGDLWFVGTVGEEGLGDLRGVRALFAEHRDAIDGFISIDGALEARIAFVAVASRRYRVCFSGPGGHSFTDFGRPSAIHALGRAVAALAELRPPERRDGADTAKTTFTVGTVSGGTSVNSIAAEASFELDLRSTDMDVLRTLEAQALSAIDAAVVAENARWGGTRPTRPIERHLEAIGDRPGGAQSVDAPIIQVASLALLHVGVEPILGIPASTDANVAISLGIPALTLGPGGASGENHTVREWYDPTQAHRGVQKNLLAVLALVGVVGVMPPVLRRRAVAAH